MDYRRLGKSDLQVSSIGLGCVTFGREIDEATSVLLCDHAVARGINFFDTADAYNYGASEAILGRWMHQRGNRSQIILSTKVGGGTNRDDPTDTGCRPERILRNIELSLQRLQTDYIDLYMVHRWDAGVPLQETLSAMDQVVRQGKARYVGCSNYMAWQLCKALWIADKKGWASYQAIQNVYNLARPDIEREVVPLCKDQQVGVVTYSPLGAGFLTGKYRRGGAVPQGARFEVVPGHQSLYFDDVRWGVMEGLRARSEKLGVPMAQLAMAWALSQPAVTSVLVGARNVGQIDNAFEAQAMHMSGALRQELTALWPIRISTDAGAA